MNKENKNQPAIWQFKVLEYTAYLIVFLIPLYFNYKYFSPFGSPKTFLFIGLVSLMMILYAWGSLKSNLFECKISGLHTIIFVFLGILTLSSSLGINPRHSFFGGFLSSVSLISLYFLAIFAYILGFLINKNKDFLIRILSLSFVSGVIVAIITYLNFNNLSLGGNSTLGNDSYTGAYLLLVACIGLGLFVFFKNYVYKILIGLGLLSVISSSLFLNHLIFKGEVTLIGIINNPTLLIGSANGATIGLGISLVIILSLWLTRLNKKISGYIGSSLFVIFAVIILLVGFNFSNENSRLRNLYAEQKTENRFAFWNIAHHSISENPVLGVGFGNYQYVFQKHFTSDFFKQGYVTEVWTDSPHNMFLEYAVVSGFLGLISYCLLLGYVFITLYKNTISGERIKKVFGIVLSGALFGYTFQNLFIFDTIVPLIFVFLIFGVAISFSDKYYFLKLSNFLDKNKKIFLLGVFVLGIFSFVLLSINPLRESKRLNTLVSKTSLKNLPDVRDGLQDISIVGGIDDTAYVSYKFANLLQKNILEINETNKDYFLREIESLIFHLEEDLKGQQNHFKAHLTIGSLLNLRLLINKDSNNVDIEKAIDHLVKARNINPQNTMSYVYISQTYLFAKDYKNAYLSMRQVLMMSPEFVDSYNMARNLLKIAPNKDFEEYVDKMETIWADKIH